MSAHGASFEDACIAAAAWRASTTLYERIVYAEIIKVLRAHEGNPVMVFDVPKEMRKEAFVNLLTCIVGPDVCYDSAHDSWIVIGISEADVYNKVVRLRAPCNK